MRFKGLKHAAHYTVCIDKQMCMSFYNKEDDSFTVYNPSFMYAHKFTYDEDKLKYLYTTEKGISINSVTYIISKVYNHMGDEIETYKQHDIFEDGKEYDLLLSNKQTVTGVFNAVDNSFNTDLATVWKWNGIKYQKPRYSCADIVTISLNKVIFTNDCTTGNIILY